MKSIVRPLLICFFSLGTILQVYASPTLQATQELLKNKEWGFIANYGQLVNEHGNPLADVKYYGHQQGVYTYCRAGKISFVFTKTDDGNVAISEAKGFSELTAKKDLATNAKISISRADMVLEGANLKAEIIATEQSGYYENYYLAHAVNKKIDKANSYKTITYKGIYPYIDMVLHSREQGIKYEFIIYPGGKVSDIKMQWNGLANTPKLIEEGIQYSMAIDKESISIKESKPVSFTSQGPVSSHFIVHGNKIGFKTGTYNTKETLTIDPDLQWCTYYGGANQDLPSKVRTDHAGNIYVGGYSVSTSGIATTGAFQTSISAGYDAILLKLNAHGSPIWCTYFGGNSTDIGYALALDASGNAFIGGYTASAGLATSGAYISSPPGSNDAFLTKFTSSGSLSWSTYVGGSLYDICNSAATDKSGNVYITGYTTSTNCFGTSGAYQTSFAGSEDAYIAKFSGSGKLIWSTYFGHDNATIGEQVIVDISGNVMLCGYTSSSGLASSGVYQSAYAGSTDGYLAKFSGSGTLAWSSYFGGSNYEMISDVCSDTSGNYYITGYTASAGLATKGAFQTSFIGQSYDAFLAKFSSSGSLFWSTYYGSAGNDVCQSITSNNKYIYICGYTSSTTGLATAGAYQSSSNGANDAYLAKYDTDGNLLWATYFGGPDSETSYSVTGDSMDNVILVGYTTSTIAIATQGAFKTKNGGTNDLFIARFTKVYPNNAGLDTLKNPAVKKCEGVQNIDVHLQNYGNKQLNSVKIRWSVDSIIQKEYQWTGSLTPGASTTVTIGSYYFPAGPHSLVAYTRLPNGVIDSIPRNDTLKAKIITSPLPASKWTISNKGNVYTFKVLDSSLGPFYYFWMLEDGFYYNGYSFTHAFTPYKAYTAKLVTTNTYGCFVEHDTSVTALPSGIENNKLQPDPYNINIYPNPLKDYTTIHFNTLTATLVQVSIADITGKVIYTSPGKNYVAGENEITINTKEAGLAAGSYFINITICDEVVVKKIVIMK